MRTILITVVLLLTTVVCFAEDRPLLECYEKADTRLDVGPCLDAQLDQAEQQLAEAVVAIKTEMAELSEITGRLDPILAFDGAQREFETYRAVNCAWYYEQMSPGTGAGDVQKACHVKLTRYRTRELQELLPDSPAEN